MLSVNKLRSPLLCTRRHGEDREAVLALQDTDEERRQEKLQACQAPRSFLECGLGPSLAGRLAAQTVGTVGRPAWGRGVGTLRGLWGLKAKQWWRTEEAGKIDWDQIAKGLEL